MKTGSRVARRAFLGASLAMLVIAGRASAGPCVDAAKADFVDCKATCREDFQVAKDACLNRDHDCVEACRAGREDCVTATGFQLAIDACNADRDGKIAGCKVSFPNPGTDRDQCIDNAQVDGFQCRDGERESHKPALNACRVGFKACALACPPANPNPDPNDPVIDRKQCRKDAKQVFKGCFAACIEDLQVGKDACHNKDHECVEGCRVLRETCNDPIDMKEASDITACNTTRDGGFANCNANPVPDLDTCIDGVQVVAFECRDAAHEAAAPGHTHCRVDVYKPCVVACPPPTP